MIGYVLPNILCKFVNVPGVKASLVTHELIRACDLLKFMTLHSPEHLASISILKKFHSEDYLNALEQRSLLNIEDLEEFGLLDDCPLFENVLEYAQILVSGSILAAQLLINSYDVAVFWSGGRHHAKRNSASGFCYVNDIVIAILELRKRYDRILYLDLDAHHGDAVEQAFFSTSSVLTLSIHRAEPGFFPCSGSTPVATGIGPGKGYAVNFPVKEGAGDSTFKLFMEQVASPIQKAYDPDIVVIQCGCDGLAMDPLGGLNLSVNGLVDCVAMALDWNVKSLLLGGGGYELANAGRCWTAITAQCIESRTGMKELLPELVPDHDLFPIYGPGFEMSTRVSHVKDRNDAHYLSDCVEKVLESCACLKSVKS